MKNLLTAAALMAMATLSGSALAGGEGECTKDKAAGSCCKAKSGEMAAGACSADKKVACTSTCEDSGMAKGGAATETEEIALGKKVPNFTVEDTAGNKFSLADAAGSPVVVVFYNQGCPYVVEVQDRLADFAKKYSEKGVKFVALDAGVSNDVKTISTQAEKMGHPIYVNPTSDLAVKFGATRTPEAYVIDKKGTLVYHGAFDNGQAGAAEGARKSYVADAVEAVLAGKDVETKTVKAFGCSIKFNPEAKAALKKVKGEAKAEMKATEQKS